jgi:hypothetical protein
VTAKANAVESKTNAVNAADNKNLEEFPQKNVENQDHLVVVVKEVRENVKEEKVAEEANKEEQPLGTGAVIEAETFRDSVATFEQSGTRKWGYDGKKQ